MPALLTALLDEDDDSGVDDALSFYLSPSSAINVDGPSHTRYDDREGFRERMELFSSEQRAIMALALEEFARRWQDEAGVAEAVKFLGPMFNATAQHRLFASRCAITFGVIYAANIC